MYEPPINIIDDIVSTINKQLEEGVYKVVCSHYIDVNKGELIRALRYDRDQYDKGYRDGIRKVVEKIVIEIINKPCEFKAEQATPDFLTGLVYRQNEIIGIIKDILHEMVGDNNG